MATSRERRKAQRETARFVRESRAARSAGRPAPHRLSMAIRAPTRARMERYANDILTGKEPEPREGSPEARQLARMAALARWNKADPKFEAAFSKYWYHDKEHSPLDEDEDEYYPEDEDEDEE